MNGCRPPVVLPRIALKYKPVFRGSNDCLERHGSSTQGALRNASNDMEALPKGRRTMTVTSTKMNRSIS